MNENYRRLAVRNPRTGADDYEIQAPGAASLAATAGRLRSAQKAWSRAGIEHRASVLRDWSAALLARPEPLLDALSTDTGRFLLARSEVNALGGMVAGYSALGRQLLADSPGRDSVTPGVFIRSQLVPYPLVGVISPWNFPFLLSTLDAIPALLAGAAVMVKPSEVTPRFVAPLMDSIARFPELAGVFHVFAGDGASGAALLDQVDAVCFTGSVRTGRSVGEHCAQRFIPSFLELGGKDPAIVLPGADPEQAASIVLRASVQGTGQACQSLERVYVPEQEHDAFVEALLRQAAQVRLNWPDMHQGHVGPLIFAPQAEIIASHLRDAVERGAVIRHGGQIESHGGGLWLLPTVVTGVNHTMLLMREETFGPVIPVMPYRDLDEAVALANDSDYGLSAAVIGDESLAQEIALRMEAGAISINDGALTTEVFDAEKNAFRLSGLGASRMGPSGLLRFLRRKALLIQRGRARDIAMLDESLAAAGPAASAVGER
ncbi:MAG: aldehyde dehydrogenase family protein [Chromatiales bacterium]|nr:aldehyde dehydrogenase family protein [Chromatiales bacterium]